MLTCVFHPIDPMRVVEECEATRLLETGVWFDCPKKAQQYRDKVENEIKKESSVEVKTLELPKAKLKGK